MSLTAVADLHSQAEGFLQSAKMAIRESPRLIEAFYGGSLDHRFHKLVTWTEEKFGIDDPLSRLIRHWEPWVKITVEMQNAVDHPEDRPHGKLLVHNFKLLSSQSVEGYGLAEPT